MTDNEIIKALSSDRYMAYGGHGCVRCKYRYHTGDKRCGVKGCKIARNALDLIKRQKAEIEELRVLVVESGKEQDKLMAEIERLSIENYRLKNTPLNDFIDTAKSEAIKEFEERVYSYLGVGHLRPPTEKCFSEIDVQRIIKRIGQKMSEEMTE